MAAISRRTLVCYRRPVGRVRVSPRRGALPVETPWRCLVVLAAALLVLAGCESKGPPEGPFGRGHSGAQSASSQAGASDGSAGTDPGEAPDGTGSGQAPGTTGLGPASGGSGSESSSGGGTDRGQAPGTTNRGQVPGTTNPGQAPGTTNRGQAPTTGPGLGESKPKDVAIQFGGPSLGSPLDRGLPFGKQPVGQSETRKVVVTAASNDPLPLTVPLTVDRIVLRSWEAAFMLAADNCSGKTLQPGDTCTLYLTVLSPAVGDAGGGLEVSLTANCSPTSTWSWCNWRPDPDIGKFGEPYERKDLPDGGALIRYLRRYLFAVVGV
jgi:hypothetical protein